MLRFAGVPPRAKCLNLDIRCVAATAGDQRLPAAFWGAAPVSGGANEPLSPQRRDGRGHGEGRRRAGRFRSLGGGGPADPTAAAADGHGGHSGGGGAAAAGGRAATGDDASAGEGGGEGVEDDGWRPLACVVWASSHLKRALV